MTRMGRPKTQPGTIGEPVVVKEHPKPKGGLRANKVKDKAPQVARAGGRKALPYTVRLRYWPLDGGAHKTIEASGTSVEEASGKALEKARRALHIAHGAEGLTPNSTVAEAWEAWLRSPKGRKASPRTIEIYQGQVNRWILPTLGAHKLGDLTTRQVAGLETAVFEGRTARVPASKGETERRVGGSGPARTVVNVMKNLIRLAEDHEVFGDRRPPKAVDSYRALRESRRATPRALTGEEAALLLDRCEAWVHGLKGRTRSAYLPALLAVLLGTGARISEGLALRPENIWSHEDGRLVVQMAGAIKKVNSSKPYYDPFDKGQLDSRRPVILDERASALLAAHMKGRTAEWVFSTRDGKMLVDRNVARRMNASMAWPVRPEVDLSWATFHTTRRTIISRLVVNGQAETARALAGHASLSTTMAYVDRGAGGAIDPGTAPVLPGRVQRHLRAV